MTAAGNGGGGGGGGGGATTNANNDGHRDDRSDETHFAPSTKDIIAELRKALQAVPLARDGEEMTSAQVMAFIRTASTVASATPGMTLKSLLSAMSGPLSARADTAEFVAEALRQAASSSPPTINDVLHEFLATFSDATSPGAARAKLQALKKPVEKSETAFLLEFKPMVLQAAGLSHGSSIPEAVWDLYKLNWLHAHPLEVQTYILNKVKFQDLTEAATKALAQEMDENTKLLRGNSRPQRGAGLFSMGYGNEEEESRALAQVLEMQKQNEIFEMRRQQSDQDHQRQMAERRQLLEQETKARQQHPQQQPLQQRPGLKCWNCKAPGHSKFQCPHPQRPHPSDEIDTLKTELKTMKGEVKSVQDSLRETNQMLKVLVGKNTENEQAAAGPNGRTLPPRTSQS